MMEESLKNRVFIFIRKNFLVVVLASLGMIFFAYGLIGLIEPASKGEDIVIESSEQAETTETITVDVEGAVVKPGVYSIKSSSRIKDALIAASGLSVDADRDWVAKNLNLAAKISDSSKIYIPKFGESVSASMVGSGITGSTGMVNINSASSQELDGLSGIGPVTTEKIISSRPYNSANDLLTKGVVSEKVFSQIKDKITTN